MTKRVKGTNWLDVCFDECELMWKWISEQYVKMVGHKNAQEVEKLKRQWLEDNGYGDGLLVHSCFFCEYAAQPNGHICSHCPGRTVDESFLCYNPFYQYNYYPVKFYEKIKDMNRRRKNENA